MRTIEKYVFHSFLTAFLLAWLVLSFVLTIGLLVRIAELIVQGVSAHVIGQFMLIGFPETLWLTIPLSLLVSALLVFSRLSADSEIAAMRACGVNLLSVMRAPLLFAAFCTLLCAYVNNEIVPRAHELRNNLKALASVDTVIKLLEPGRNIDEFDKVKLFFTRKEGNWLYNLRANDFTQEGITRLITADKVLISTNGSDIVFDMYNVCIDPIDVGKPGMATMSRFTYVITDAMQQRGFNRKEKDYRFVEMRQTIAALRKGTAREDARPPEMMEGEPRHSVSPREPWANLTDTERQRRLSICRTLFNKRLVEAFAALCFVLVGVPLGIKTHRKDSTIGMGVSLIVALVYYVIIILATELQKNPTLYPHLLIWLPVAICGVLAMVLIPRNL